MKTHEITEQDERAFEEERRKQDGSMWFSQRALDDGIDWREHIASHFFKKGIEYNRQRQLSEASVGWADDSYDRWRLSTHGNASINKYCAYDAYIDAWTERDLQAQREMAAKDRLFADERASRSDNIRLLTAELKSKDARISALEAELLKMLSCFNKVTGHHYQTLHAEDFPIAAQLAAKQGEA